MSLFLDKYYTVKLKIVKIVGKIEICSIWANFFESRARLPSRNEQKTPILAIFCAISPKQPWWPPNFFHSFHRQVNDLKYKY